jgi:hypothetical protein
MHNANADLPCGFRRCFPCSAHFGEESVAAGALFVQFFFTPITIEPDCRCADQRPRRLSKLGKRLTEQPCALYAAGPNPLFLLDIPSPCRDVLPSEMDDGIKGLQSTRVDSSSAWLPCHIFATAITVGSYYTKDVMASVPEKGDESRSNQTR